MAHPRVEELEDSDPEEMDISSLALPSSSSSIIERNTAPTNDPTSANPTLLGPSSIPSPGQPMVNAQRNQIDQDRIKNWQCLYPLYFDASRTRAEGRRVGKEQAVQNPLAREIVEAVAKLGMQVAFEPGKCHPKDWANPGRIKVCVKDEQSGRVNRNFGGVEGKHHLYIKVAEHLRANPTTAQTPLKMKIPGLPVPDGSIPPPEVPRGWKMNTILPLHSPAMTGGGVSENMFKDMMEQMGGMGGGQERDQSPAAGKKKKDKKIKG